MDQIGTELKILVAIRKLGDEAWSLRIKEEFDKTHGWELSLGQLCLSLQKLTKKELIRFEIMPPEPRRGGRSKKNYSLTEKGLQTILEIIEFLKGN